MKCPKCDSTLGKVKIRIRPEYGADILNDAEQTSEIEVDQCLSCNGIWFDAGEFDKCLSEHVNVLDSPEVNQALIKELNQKTGKCPRCQVDMVKKQAPKDPKVQIDYCEKCQGVWLDGGEYDRLESKNLGQMKKVILVLQNFFSQFKPSSK